jgi:hypothetical protein
MPKSNWSFNRRRFIGALGLTGAATATGLNAKNTGKIPASAPSDGIGTVTSQDRQNMAFGIRRDAALYHRDQPLSDHVTNGDESIPNYIATFSKGLLHNSLGEVDGAAYQTYLQALSSGKGSDFDNIPMGGPAKLVNPQASYAFTSEGPDGQLPTAGPPPGFSSATMAAEMAEDYWLALTRDIPFAQYDTDPLIAQAAAWLSAKTPGSVLSAVADTSRS